MKTIKKLLLVSLAAVLTLGFAACAMDGSLAGEVGTKFETIDEGWADIPTYGDVYSVSLAIDPDQVTVSNIKGVTFKTYNGSTLLGTATLNEDKITELFVDNELPETGDGSGRKALSSYFLSSTADEALADDGYWTRTPAKTTLVRPARPTKVVCEVKTAENGKNYLYTVTETAE